LRKKKTLVWGVGDESQKKEGGLSSRRTVSRPIRKDSKCKDFGKLRVCVACLAKVV